MNTQLFDIDLDEALAIAGGDGPIYDAGVAVGGAIRDAVDYLGEVGSWWGEYFSS